MSRDAANVLSGVPPIRLLALEQKEIWVEEEEYRLRQGHLSEEERNIIRARARETLFKRWQKEWDSSKDGRWTHKLIPKIKEWVLREHGSMEYRLTQGLGGHGCFSGYLVKRGHRPNSNYRLYGEEEDDIRLPRIRAGQEGTNSTSWFAIVQRQHNSDHAQVAKQLGQDSFFYQEGNQDQRRKGERNEKKRLIG